MTGSAAQLTPAPRNLPSPRDTTHSQITATRGLITTCWAMCYQNLPGQSFPRVVSWHHFFWIIAILDPDGDFCGLIWRSESLAHGSRLCEWRTVVGCVKELLYQESSEGGQIGALLWSANRSCRLGGNRNTRLDINLLGQNANINGRSVARSVRCGPEKCDGPARCNHVGGRGAACTDEAEESLVAMGRGSVLGLCRGRPAVPSLHVQAGRNSLVCQRVRLIF